MASLSGVIPMNMLHDMAKRDTADVVKISNQLNLKKIILDYLRVPNVIKQMLKSRDLSPAGRRKGVRGSRYKKNLMHHCWLGD